MTGFYHFNDVNCDHYTDSGYSIYKLKMPYIEMYDKDNDHIKQLSKPIIIDIKEFGPAFVVPENAWSFDFKMYGWDIDVTHFEIMATTNYYMFPDELCVLLVGSPGGR